MSLVEIDMHVADTQTTTLRCSQDAALLKSELAMILQVAAWERIQPSPVFLKGKEEHL